jgi:hypothetical protein
MSGSLVTAAKETSKYTTGLVGVEAVRWDRNNTTPEVKHIFFYGKINDNHGLGIGFNSIIT